MKKTIQVGDLVVIKNSWWLKGCMGVITRYVEKTRHSPGVHTKPSTRTTR
jgi:hypothetical protein